MKTNAIIVDLGGTLAHRGDRAKSDYMTKFHEDQVDKTVRELVNMVADSGIFVIILTGQRERSREITIQWLTDHGVKYDSLRMKPDDDIRDTLDWKKAIYEEELQYSYNIKYVLEDREDTVEMWRNHQVKCFQTASGQDREYYKQKSINKFKTKNNVQSRI